MAKKTYTIRVNSKNAREFLRELDGWNVRHSQYYVLVITEDSNVVDVATETFIRRKERIMITVA